MRLRIHHIVSAVAMFLPAVASAHAFGQQFTLPLPVSLFVIGGIGAFVASCVALLQFSDPHTGADSPKLRTYTIPERLISRSLLTVGVILFTISIIVGVFGTQDFSTNPIPNLFWIIFLLLFTYLTAIVGGLWPYIDPTRRIAAIFARNAEDRTPPEWLPYTPAIFFYALLWLELFSPGWGGIPAVLIAVFIVYVAFTCVMCRIYGFNTWFAYGDFFSTFFGLVSKVAPVQLTNSTATISFPGERLVHEKVLYPGTLFFIFVILGSTVLDGLRETQAWYDFIYAFNLTDATVFYLTGVAALFLLPIFLFALYTLAIHLMQLLTQSDRSLSDLGLDFAYSLIPIAIAYHFAHYFSLILSNGQDFYRQISDPLGMGWDLFGTATYQMNPGLIGADKVWYLQFGAIVLGHILAAIVAHRIAKRLFPTTQKVILSQLPMLVLMVFYTAFGLWTLAQPFATG